jgi:adhesin transport system membrane fusion protein
MLNLSNQRVLQNVEGMELSALERVDLPDGQKLFRRWLVAAAIIGIAMMFLPWVQNFRAKGTVTALDPAFRPQTIHSTIPGRIEAWSVFEGDTVSFGDTIARLSEIKPEYLDPDIVPRTAEMRQAKSNSAEGYLEKVAALNRQIQNFREEQANKLELARNKLTQAKLKVITLEADLAQQEVQVSIAEYQRRRSDTLLNEGLKPLTDLEAKRLKEQESNAKYIKISNELDQAKTDVEQAQIEIDNVGPTYRGKIAKAMSDRASALTSYYASVGDVAKLSIQESNYSIRQSYNYILAPQDGIIAKVLTPGIGETVKEGDPVVSILPAQFKAAVEIFVEPFNLPLVRPGQQVRFLFDGWPAIFFSGWPGLSYGTFVGEVVAVDNIIDSKGRYRVLVGPSNDGRDWPTALRPGSGADGVALLSTVPVWYELWRQLNAFPPDYYQDTGEDEEVKTKAKKSRVVK